VLSTGIDFLIGLLVSRGKVTRLQYLKASGWIFLSAFLYLFIEWPPSILDISQIRISELTFELFPILVIVWAGATLGIRYLMKADTVIDKRKIFVGISVASNLAILGFFKYFNFFIESAESLVVSLGGDASLYHLNIVLPVGISFYTFQTISYSIDVFRKEIKPTEHFLDFALFVAYFPQLVAGPIERAKNLLPKIISPRQFNYEQIRRGLFLIAWGLFKKIAIADAVATSVNSVYETSGTVSALDVLLATVLFAIQIYCDFSGYSDIARGTSKLMGIELMRNFNLPYFSTNPSEFWRRWHISLSSWLRDYLYIPLGGSKGTLGKTYRNLMMTMLLGGLWHGAAWNFILWGAYQGGILSLHRFFQGNKKMVPAGLPLLTLKILFFFGVTCYGWLLFRANSISQVIDFTSILLFDWDDLSMSIKRPPIVAFLSIPLLIIHDLSEYLAKDGKFSIGVRKPAFGFIAAYTMLMIAMGLSNEPSQFIYFQF
jgi:D-alanyl-lipoteichoic acid acyltransferase DltB (MBOAT superfamily)